LLYRSVFEDVRLYESFKWLHVGIVSELPRKTLPKIAKLNGLKDGQGLHYFLRDGVWDVEQVRSLRLHLLQQQIGQRGISLCIDETGDVKQGETTDYTAKQYIGNLGKTAPGMVSVNAYAVVETITYPLLSRVYKPKSRLKDNEVYQSKPELAVELIREIEALGFVIERVLADSLYGESGNFIGTLESLKLPYIVAIRSNHGVLMMPGQQVRYKTLSKGYSLAGLRLGFAIANPNLIQDLNRVKDSYGSAFWARGSSPAAAAQAAEYIGALF
jgi:SRSO17 transposase